MCGIFGVVADHPIAMVGVLRDGLWMLNHRGQEGSGFVFSDGEKPLNELHECRLSPEDSSVRHLFNKQRKVDPDGKFLIASGHNRYPTAGTPSKLENLQPMVVQTRRGSLALSHNGNIPNTDKIREALEEKGDSFSSDSDTEIILRLVAREWSATDNLVEAITQALLQVEGAYSLLFMTKSELVAVRDPRGMRPLYLATFDNGYMISSEDCAFAGIDKKYGVRDIREVEPGEIIVLSTKGVRSSFKPFPPQPLAQCIFELIYFARPDSIIFGKRVGEFRINVGKSHAKLQPMVGNCVVGVPDSANFYASGLAKGLGVDNSSLSIVRNHYVSRTFINSGELERRANNRLKLAPVPWMIEGQGVILAEDSIVRGHASRRTCQMMLRCRPKSLAMASSFPPVRHPCYYGIDMKTEKELTAVSRGIEGAREYMGADYLYYNTLENLREISGEGFCFGCCDGNYPTPV